MPDAPQKREFTPLDKAVRVLTGRAAFSMNAARAFLLTLKGDELQQLTLLHDEPEGRPDALLGQIADRKAAEEAARKQAEEAAAAAALPPGTPAEAATNEPPAASLDEPTVLETDAEALARWETNGGALAMD